MMECLDSSILVIPAVSSGNIPQLAIDLMIHSYEASLITRLNSQFMYPVVGARDVASGCEIPSKGITTPVEVYYANGVTFIQIRSPTLPGQRTKFVEETILPFISEHKFTETIVLGSAIPGFQHSAGNLRFKIYSANSEATLVKRLALLRLDNEPVIEVDQTPSELSESRIIVDILKNVPSASGLVIYAYEGDNFQDAEDLAAKLVLTLAGNLRDKVMWKRPESWKGAYGREIPVGMEEGLYA